MRMTGKIATTVKNVTKMMQKPLQMTQMQKIKKRMSEKNGKDHKR